MVYTGTGGVTLAPRLSWVFEHKFMLSYTDSAMHVMRYKDIFDRMAVMFPYFVYDFSEGTSQTDLNIGITPKKNAIVSRKNCFLRDRIHY